MRVQGSCRYQDLDGDGDGDGDGLGNGNLVTQACEASTNGAWIQAGMPLDCDDDDPNVTMCGELGSFGGR
jgi:hypothetical protein